MLFIFLKELKRKSDTNISESQISIITQKIGRHLPPIIDFSYIFLSILKKY